MRVIYVWTIPSSFTSDLHYGNILDKKRTHRRRAEEKLVTTGDISNKNHWIDLHNKWSRATWGVVATNLMHLHPNKKTFIHELYRSLAPVYYMLRSKTWCQAIQMLKCQWWLCGCLMWTICYPCAMYTVCKNKVHIIRVPVTLLLEISLYLHIFSTLVQYVGDWSAAYHHGFNTRKSP